MQRTSIYCLTPLSFLVLLDSQKPCRYEDLTMQELWLEMFCVGLENCIQS